MTIISYILLFILTTVSELWITIRSLDTFAKETIKSGYKINLTYFKDIAIKEYNINIVDYILQLIPGINMVYFFLRFKHTLKKIKRNPEFIANLVPIHPFDETLINEKLNMKNIQSIIDRMLEYYVICLDVEINHEKVDVGAFTKKELKNNDFAVTKEVIDKMANIGKEDKQIKVIDPDKSFYTLPGEYNLSNVYKIDETAFFIKTKEGMHVAIVNATNEEFNEFVLNSLSERPSLDVMYHIISLKPFDKDLLRKNLYEIEYAKINPSQIIDTKMKDVTDSKKRTL